MCGWRGPSEGDQDVQRSALACRPHRIVYRSTLLSVLWSLLRSEPKPRKPVVEEALPRVARVLAAAAVVPMGRARSCRRRPALSGTGTACMPCRWARRLGPTKAPRLDARAPGPPKVLALGTRDAVTECAIKWYAALIASQRRPPLSIVAAPRVRLVCYCVLLCLCVLGRSGGPCSVECAQAEETTVVPSSAPSDAFPCISVGPSLPKSKGPLPPR